VLEMIDYEIEFWSSPSASHLERREEVLIADLLTFRHVSPIHSAQMGMLLL
jgi:hypothetical protein